MQTSGFPWSFESMQKFWNFRGPFPGLRVAWKNGLSLYVSGKVAEFFSQRNRGKICEKSNIDAGNRLESCHASASSEQAFSNCISHEISIAHVHVLFLYKCFRVSISLLLVRKLFDLVWKKSARSLEFCHTRSVGTRSSLDPHGRADPWLSM